MCHIRSAPSSPAPPPSVTATMLTASTTMMMRRCGEPVGGDAADQDERHQADAKARGDQRQRGRVVVEGDDLQRHHHGPHAGGEDRQRRRRRSAGGTRGTGRVRARASRRRPPAGRLSNCVLTHRWSPTDGRASNDFRTPGVRRALRVMPRPASAYRTIETRTLADRREPSGVGEGGGPALLERPGALAEVVRAPAAQLALGLTPERGLEFGQRRGVDGVLGLAQAPPPGRTPAWRSPCPPRRRGHRPDTPR